MEAEGDAPPLKLAVAVGERVDDAVAVAEEDADGHAATTRMRRLPPSAISTRPEASTAMPYG